jgi:hypothetical protein
MKKKIEVAAPPARSSAVAGREGCGVLSGGNGLVRPEPGLGQQGAPHITRETIVIRSPGLGPVRRVAEDRRREMTRPKNAVVALSKDEFRAPVPVHPTNLIAEHSQFVAEIVATPSATPVANPVAVIDTIELFELLQITDDVMSFPRLSVALNCI